MMRISLCLAILCVVWMSGFEIWRDIRDCKGSGPYKRAVMPCYTAFLAKQSLEPSSSDYERAGFANDLYINNYCNYNMAEYIDFLKCLNSEDVKCYESINYPGLAMTSSSIESAVKYYCSRSVDERNMSCSAGNTEIQMCYAVGYTAITVLDANSSHQQHIDYKCRTLWIAIECLKDNKMLVATNCTEAQTTFLQVLKISLPPACLNETSGQDQIGGESQNGDGKQNGDYQNDGENQNGDENQNGEESQNGDENQNGDQLGDYQNDTGNQNGDENKNGDRVGDYQNDRENQTDVENQNGEDKFGAKDLNGDENQNGDEVENGGQDQHGIRDAERSLNNSDTGRHTWGLFYPQMASAVLLCHILIP